MKLIVRGLDRGQDYVQQTENERSHSSIKIAGASWRDPPELSSAADTEIVWGEKHHEGDKGSSRDRIRVVRHLRLVLGCYGPRQQRKRGDDCRSSALLRGGKRQCEERKSARRPRDFFLDHQRGLCGVVSRPSCPPRYVYQSFRGAPDIRAGSAPNALRCPGPNRPAPGGDFSRPWAWRSCR